MAQKMQLKGMLMPKGSSIRPSTAMKDGGALRHPIERKECGVTKLPAAVRRNPAARK